LEFFEHPASLPEDTKLSRHRPSKRKGFPAMTVWRLMPLWQGSGQIQMAIDQWLFEQCHQGQHPPVLRFYRWEPAAISLGYHQKEWPPHWQTLRWQNQPIDLVRRPTGGRAVLHAGDLTYCIVLPHQSGHRRQTYEYICKFLIEGWRSLGLELGFGTVGRGYQREVNCFESATAADLVTPDGVKLMGSAQVWRGQTVLQHGSMQLQPNAGLHQAVFGGNAPSSPQPKGLEQAFQDIADRKIIEALTVAAAAHFGVSFHEEALTHSEWNAIQNYSDKVL
jgi:lipoate-protein ligase A